MKPSLEIVSLLAILDKQLHAVQELSAELIACRTAFAAMNVEAIYRHIAVQTTLCDDLRTLDEQRKEALRAACSAEGIEPTTASLNGLIVRFDSRVGTKIRDIVTKLVLAEGELRQLNRANTILIDGSRRTLTILGNLLSSFAPTYASPISARNSAAPARSVTVR